MGTVTIDQLTRACGDLSEDAGITVRTELEPLAGPSAPVKPATYEGGRYQLDRRWWAPNEDEELVDVQAVVIDNVPSQANRYEAALDMLRRELGLPEIILDLSGIETLPPHLPRRFSGLRFPHRNADAYLLDAMLNGQRFPDTTVGKAIFAATPDEPLALFEWFPQALLYGFWQSHLGKKRSQAKLARSWTSEIVGYHPATTETKTFGLKGDPLNLAVNLDVAHDENDRLANDWTLKATGTTRGNTKAKDRLSNVGHGQVLADAAPAGISFAAINQQSTVSFAGLRRLQTGIEDADPPARALLVSLGLVAHVAAFGRSFSLRSGCELRPKRDGIRWQWLGGSEDDEVAPLTQVDAIELFRQCTAQAEAAGLPVGSRWATEPLVLSPNESLTRVIRQTWPLEH